MTTSRSCSLHCNVIFSLSLSSALEYNAHGNSPAMSGQVFNGTFTQYYFIKFIHKYKLVLETMIFNNNYKPLDGVTYDARVKTDENMHALLPCYFPFL